VLNRGVNGEETPQMIARFDSAVITAHPDLVLWQVGTNSVMRDHSLNTHAALLRQGIAQLEGSRCGCRTDGYAICPARVGQSRGLGHGGSARARRQGSERGSVWPLCCDAELG